VFSGASEAMENAVFWAVGLTKTDVSKELMASIFSIEKS
jgi:hypothetical protein